MRGSNRRQFLGRVVTGFAGGSVTAVLRADSLQQKGGRESGSPPAGHLKPTSSSLADLGPGGIATKFWIDPRLAALPAWPWRKVHIEFHNSHYVPRIGERFNADEFGDQLLEAHATCASVFAKDMFGYSYYPSS